jgi:hypothetical protein
MSSVQFVRVSATLTKTINDIAPNSENKLSGVRIRFERAVYFELYHSDDSSAELIAICIASSVLKGTVSFSLPVVRTELAKLSAR